MTDKKLLRLDLDAIAVRLEQQPSRITNYSRISTKVFDEICSELKRMYEREDALVSAIKELCDSEDSTGCSGDLTVVSLDPMLKLYELTSYSAYR
jgi:CRISPR/Cas system CSM-associated protein Csm4 (group 5 of RAMP superfamily)